jgi:nitrite reductase/ring-hydroxylating ferredoxin subunit
MKQIFGLLLILSLFSCDDTDDNNPFLPNFPVNFTINLNLAEGSDIRFVGGYKTFEGINFGIKGVVVYHVTENNFVAFELACPHIELQDCSLMNVDFPFLICPCDDEKFQMIDGGSVNGLSSSARPYNVTKNGNILRITN